MSEPKPWQIPVPDSPPVRQRPRDLRRLVHFWVSPWFEPASAGQNPPTVSVMWTSHGCRRSGAVVQGLGGVFLEQLVYDDDADLLTDSFSLTPNSWQLRDVE